MIQYTFIQYFFFFKQREYIKETLGVLKTYIKKKEVRVKIPNTIKSKHLKEQV